MTETEIAWAAGLFEGEGSMQVRPSKAEKHVGRPYAVMSLGMTDRDVVERFVALMGCGRISHYQRNRNGKNHKDFWFWQIARRAECKRIAEMFLPYFGERRAARAREIIEATSIPDGRAAGITKKHPHLIIPS